jgi:hypothetical protein
MSLSVALGIHVVDVLVYPVMQVPGGQSLAFVEQVRATLAGSAGGTVIDMAKLGLEVYSIGAIDWLDKNLMQNEKDRSLNGLDDQRLTIFNQCVLYPLELRTDRLQEQPRTTRHYESRSTI